MTMLSVSGLIAKHLLASCFRLYNPVSHHLCSISHLQIWSTHNFAVQFILIVRYHYQSIRLHRKLCLTVRLHHWSILPAVHDSEVQLFCQYLLFRFSGKIMVAYLTIMCLIICVSPAFARIILLIGLCAQACNLNTARMAMSSWSRASNDPHNVRFRQREAPLRPLPKWSHVPKSWKTSLLRCKCVRRATVVCCATCATQLSLTIISKCDIRLLL